MNTSLIRYSFFTLCVGILLASLWILPARLAYSADETLAVSVLTPKVTQGGTAFFLVDAPDATVVRLRHGEKAYPAQRRQDGRWEAIVGVYREEAAGEYPLIVEAEIDGKPVTTRTAFTITARDFPVQYLRMSATQSAKYDAPSVDEEYRLIGKALASNTPRMWSGAFRVPIEGRLSTRYGEQRYRNGKKVNIHKGVDLSAPQGTIVYAANTGKVILRRDFLLHGRTVIIDHGGGVVGLYLHLNEFGVSEGQQVTAGQKIARVGSTGAATGPHLHYGLYVHGLAVDPMLWNTVPEGW